MTVLVTGGGGFLGRNLVKALVDRGDAVRTLARGDYPFLREWGVDHRRGDLSDPEAVGLAVAGCDLVYHVAARAGVWGAEADFFQSNVVGTRNVLQACRAHGVGRLVYTSSPSVVHGGHDIEGADESLPYPPRHGAPYPRTKALAEREVLAANVPDLLTVALRPHLIWGPGDTQLVARIIARGRTGRLRLPGDGRKRVDTVYIDNAVSAHLAAARALQPGAACAGRAYFITNGDPRPVGDIINAFLAAAGVPPVTRFVPVPLAWTVAALTEGFHRIFLHDREPMLTRYLVTQLSSAHWFDISAARRDLGWEPAVGIDEGLARLKRSFQGEGVTR